MSLIQKQDKFRGGIKLMPYSRFVSDRYTAFTAVEGFTEEFGRLAELLEACYFYPYPENIYRKTINFKKHWVDCIGNSIYFIRRGQMKFVENDPANDPSINLNFDYWAGRSVLDIIKLGKKYYCATGIDDQDQVEIVLTVVGIDNKIRSYVKIDKWYPFSLFKFGLDFIEDFWLMQKPMDLPVNLFTKCTETDCFTSFDKDEVINYLKGWL